MKIQLTSIYVNDPIEAFKFYTETIGFKEQMYMPKANLAIVVSPEEENGTTLLLEPSDNPIAKEYMTKLYDAGLPAIVLSADDLQKEHKRLKQSAVVFRKEPTKTEWGYEAIFDDSCGNWIQLVQQ
ncbi:MAG: glyoxalase [Balneolaceae bacterium]|nr:glyoxalase [Balneolaceae bacterium]